MNLLPGTQRASPSGAPLPTQLALAVRARHGQRHPCLDRTGGPRLVSAGTLGQEHDGMGLLAMVGRAWGWDPTKRVSGLRQEGLGAKDSMSHISRGLWL